MLRQSIKEIEVKARIKFRSKNPNDPAVWTGVLESGISSYRSIVHLQPNPSPYHEAVRQSDPTIPSDVKALSFFVISLDNKVNANDSEAGALVVFAEEWIERGTLEEVSLGSSVTLKVTDPYNDSTKVIALLASAGYSSKIVS